MNGKELLEKMSDVDGALIIEAENVSSLKKKKAPLFIGIGAVAAAAAIALSVNFFGAGLRQPFIDNNLPKLDYEFTVGGMGFEGFDLSDISEYKNGNPYTADMKLKTMPVLKSNIQNPDKEKMTQYLKTMAEKLGIDPNSLELTYSGFDIDEQLESYKKMMEEQNVPPEEMEEELEWVRKKMIAGMGIEVMGENESVWLTVNSDYTFGIHFDRGDSNGIALPEGYNKENTVEERQKTAEYLLEQYGYTLQNLKDPVTNVYTEGDEIGFYDKGKTDAESILNYQLNRSWFGISEQGNLFVIWVNSTYGCEKMGDYPIISAEEAKQQLLEGRYLSSVILNDPTGFSEEDVAYTEITYRMDRASEYALPFYRFLVKLPDDYVNSDEGKSCYGAFYVPAVEEQYISNPIISFNGSPIEMLPK